MNTFSIELPELLYFSLGKTVSPQLHQHAFYQIEFCLSGRLICKKQGEFFSLAPGEFWLLPPELPHQFVENSESCEYLSLKFSSNIILPPYHGGDPEFRYYLNSILNVINKEGSISPFSPDGKSIIETLLYGILHHRSALPAASEPQESPFLMSIREEVCRHGYKINVAELADFFQYSRSQLQYRFMKEHHGDANIKGFIEDILISLVENHLKYSAMKLSQIAHTMNFPSIYIFSRFYKRKTGHSPLERRKAISSSLRAGSHCT